MNRDYRNRFGQMIILGLDLEELNDEVVSLIRDYKIGGVIIYKKSYHTVDDMITYINRLKKINESNIPLFIAIDQENGRVNRFPPEIKRMASALKIAKGKNLEMGLKSYEITASLLSSIGVNMNFAPVLDINRGSDDSIIGDRGYGNSYQEVVKYGLPFMKKLTDKGIISVVKHFPGHGLSNVNSHYAIPKINEIDLMEKEDLQVFGRAIEDGCEALMVGHLRVKGCGFKPATINRFIIHKYLIDRYNYQGLIITDDLRMNLLRTIYGMKRVIKYSIMAGNNLLVIKYHKGDTKLYDKIFKMIESGEIKRELIDGSYNKIRLIKEKYGISNEMVDNKIDILEVNRMIDGLSKIK